MNLNNYFALFVVLAALGVLFLGFDPLLVALGGGLGYLLSLPLGWLFDKAANHFN